MSDQLPTHVSNVSHDPMSAGGFVICLVSAVMEYLDVHSSGIVALCAIVGAICTVIGLIRSWNKGDKDE